MSFDLHMFMQTLMTKCYFCPIIFFPEKALDGIKLEFVIGFCARGSAPPDNFETMLTCEIMA